MKSKMLKMSGWGIVCVFVVLMAADSFDFVSRWLKCIEPYKDNLERSFYFVVILILLLHNWRKIPELVQKIRGLKVAARGVGFEVEFTGNEETVDSETSDGVRPEGGTCEKYINGKKFESFALERLGLEMGVSFSHEVRLSHTDVFCKLDGFAVKSGRAYAVEVKAAYRPEFRRQYFEQLRQFTKALMEQHRQNLTFIFCVLTDKPIEEVRRQLGNIDQIVGCDVIIRTFSLVEVQKQ